MAEPRVVDAPERQRFELIVDDDIAGFVTYLRAPREITLFHTQVEDEYEGHGLGRVLAAAVLDDARAKGLAVRPECPFIRKYIAEHPEYADLVPPDFDR
jgi:uncharacterized protein